MSPRDLALAIERILVRAQRPLSWGLLVAAVCVDIAAWMHLIARHEPPVVLHLSTWAIIYSAFTAVLVTEKK